MYIYINILLYIIIGYLGGLIGGSVDMYKKDKFKKWMEFFQKEKGFSENMFWAMYFRVKVLEGKSFKSKFYI